MRIVKASATMMGNIDGERMLRTIERAGRTCYKSEEKITDTSARQFVKMISKNGHHSVLEHASFSVLFVCDRGVSHEIVRHRLASYSQESSRYCNYSKEKFGNEITVIDPFFGAGSEARRLWEMAVGRSEINYFAMLKEGLKPEMARSVLPNSLKTELVMTANLREWHHFFTLRTAKAAHPQMREITIPLLAEVQSRIPVVFDGIRGYFDGSIELTD